MKLAEKRQKVTFWRLWIEDNNSHHAPRCTASLATPTDLDLRLSDTSLFHLPSWYRKTVWKIISHNISSEEYKLVKTIRFRFMWFRDISVKTESFRNSIELYKRCSKYSRCWFSTEKVERIKPARCIQTFSHEEIQPFKLSRNTF